MDLGDVLGPEGQGKDFIRSRIYKSEVIFLVAVVRKVRDFLVAVARKVRERVKQRQI